MPEWGPADSPFDDPRLHLDLAAEALERAIELARAVGYDRTSTAFARLRVAERAYVLAKEAFYATRDAV